MHIYNWALLILSYTSNFERVPLASKLPPDKLELVAAFNQCCAVKSLKQGSPGSFPNKTKTILSFDTF